MYHSFSKKYSAPQLFSTLIIIRYVSWAANQYIWMISGGSCDTEDWSNDPENSALNHSNKLYFKTYFTQKTAILNCNNITQTLQFCSVFLIKAVLESWFLSTTTNIFWTECRVWMFLNVFDMKALKNIVIFLLTHTAYSAVQLYP